MLKDHLQQPTVLVLNRNWQAINVRTPAEAVCQMATDVATALDIENDSMVPVRWKDWIKLPIRDHDDFIQTVRGKIRVPTVIVLCNYAKVPMKRPTLSLRSIAERDSWTCQYTGKKLKPGEGSVDHVVPRAKGGGTTWDNCVLAAKDVNCKKSDKTLAEAGLKLLKKPVEPKPVPVTVALKNHHAIPDWKPFLK